MAIIYTDNYIREEEWRRNQAAHKFTKKFLKDTKWIALSTNAKAKNQFILLNTNGFQKYCRNIQHMKSYLKWKGVRLSNE